MKTITFVLGAAVATMFYGCEKDITVKIPAGDEKIVVEGRMQIGSPPFVVLTRSMPYFDRTDLAAFEGSFVHDAVIEVSDGISSITLSEFCSANYSDDELRLISGAIGISYELLRNVNYCLYTAFPTSFVGKENATYSLKITAGDEVFTSTTQIPHIVHLDSVYFRVEKDQVDKGLGFAWGHLTDPDTLGNCYFWRTQRLGKDQTFRVPNGAVFDDKFINGKSFEFGYDRPLSEEEDPLSEEAGYYKVGDTIIVLFTSMDRAHYEFRQSLYNSTGSNGNPFSSPVTIKTNIIGNALGYWGGFANSQDTIFAR